MNSFQTVTRIGWAHMDTLRTGQETVCADLCTTVFPRLQAEDPAGGLPQGMDSGYRGGQKCGRHRSARDSLRYPRYGSEAMSGNSTSGEVGTVRGAVIGLGWFGEVHADTLAGMPGIELAALCRRRPERLAGMADPHHREGPHT